MTKIFLFFFRFIPNNPIFAFGQMTNTTIMFITANFIPVTRAAIIQEILDSPLKINLMELGFLPGKTITLHHSAPLGGPMAFKLDETILALRKTEASLIEVQLL